MTASVVKHLKPEKDILNIVEIKPYEAITGYLSALRNKSIWLSNHASQALVSWWGAPPIMVCRDDLLPLGFLYRVSDVCIYYCACYSLLLLLQRPQKLTILFPGASCPQTPVRVPQGPGAWGIT